MNTKLKKKTNSPFNKKGQTKKNRKGIHAKTKQSKNKHSILYKKPYNGQGR